MSSGRGDLVRLLGALVPEDAELAAGLLGYRLEAAAPDARPDPGHAAPLPAGEPVPASTLRTGLRGSFWRIEEVEFHGPPVATVTTAEEGLRPEDFHDPARSLFRRPVCPPIAPWSWVEPRLHRALTAGRPGRTPDVDAMVCAIGRGRVLARIPRLPRRGWPPALRVWFDRSPRHFTVEEDQEEVLRRLCRLCGLDALRLGVVGPGDLRAGPAAAAEAAEGDDGSAVLVLGDLGAGGTAEDRAAWLAIGKVLARARAPAVVLCPVGLDRLPSALTSTWRVVPWQVHPVAAGSPTDRVERARRLLRLASPAGLVQPGLLRALRLLLPAAEADAGTEMDVSKLPEVRACDASGLVLHAGELGRLRAEFVVAEPPALRQRVSALLAQWHRGLPAELLHAETIDWAARDPAGAWPGDLDLARAFFRRLERGLGGGLEDREAETCREYAREALRPMPDAVYREGDLGPVLQRLWARSHRGDLAAEVPAGVELSVLRAVAADTPAPRAWALRQIGPSLRVEAAPDRPDPATDPPRPGSPVAVVPGTSWWVVEGPGGRQKFPLRAGVEPPLPDDAGFVLATDRATARLVRWRPEPWVSAAGRDRFGLWAEARVGAVAFRLRWIPPGTFVMGSPEGEAGRRDDEGPLHEVTLTRGYWLGETPATQALWQEVMGNNPSRFKSPDRPVEQVSWEECREFCAHLNARVAGLGVRLPTEAEWEHACRAGTPGATWLGDLEVRGENDAPLLDGIAWYGGNSGVGFELKDGWDSRGWPNKQYPHEQAGTRPVGRKAANPWGLRDMLGNVLEWCEDAYAPYEGVPATDPLVVEGSERVLRGGSWFSDARSVRAASRDGWHPVGRSDDLGFRLARGPSAPVERAAEPPRGRSGQRAEPASEGRSPEGPGRRRRG